MKAQFGFSAIDSFKNFNMGRELEIAGGFIYESAVRMNQLSYIGNHFELNAILYNGSVGVERLQKILLCMYINSPEDLENPKKCLLEHNHTSLNHEIQKQTEINFNKNEESLFALFEKYYREFRYAEYRLNYNEQIMCQEFIVFINKHIGTHLSLTNISIASDYKKMKSFYINLLGEIALKHYRKIQDKMYELKLFTCELHSFSNAIKVFYRLNEEKLYDRIQIENYAFKEILVYLKKARYSTHFLKYLNAFTPLDFDKAMIPEYLQDLSFYKPSNALNDAVEDMYTNFGEKELKERKAKLDLISEDIIWE